MNLQTCLSLLVFCLVISSGCHRTTVEPDTSVSDGGATGTVTVVVQADGSEAETVMVDEVAAGTTLEMVMRSIKEIPIEISGSGQTAFVQSMGDVATDATQGWTFKVDGEFANQGMGVTLLQPPTTVTWSYGEFEM